MTSLIIALLFAVLMMTAIVLSKTYRHLPIKELKRLARSNDATAKILYKSASYTSLETLLWVITVLSAAAAFILFTNSTPAWFAFLLVVFLIWIGFLWLPSAKLSSYSVRLATVLSPAVAWILYYTHRQLEFIGKLTQSIGTVNVHTGVYEKDDLLDLIKWQKKQPDNRIPDYELALVGNALNFGDKTVKTILVPRRVIKTVGPKDTIGPVLMNELHESGQSRFPVVDGKPEHIVGVLYEHDLLDAAHGGKISSVMQRAVQYVHEDFSLHQVLQAFLATRQHLFIVVNEFEEFVGIVTIDDVLAQLVGHPIGEEFSEYDNLRAVAQAMAHKEHVKHDEAPAESKKETE